MIKLNEVCTLTIPILQIRRLRHWEIHLPKFRQLVRDGASLQIPGVWLQSPCLRTPSLDTSSLGGQSWHLTPRVREPASSRELDQPHPPGALSERVPAGTGLWSHAGGASGDNGTTCEHQARPWRQCSSPNTSPQHNKLPQHRSLNIEMELPCIATCGEISGERRQLLLLSGFPRGKIWGCFSSSARLPPPLSLQPRVWKRVCLMWARPGDPQHPTVIFAGL